MGGCNKPNEALSIPCLVLVKVTSPYTLPPTPMIYETSSLWDAFTQAAWKDGLKEPGRRRATEARVFFGRAAKAWVRSYYACVADIHICIYYTCVCLYKLIYMFISISTYICVYIYMYVKEKHIGPKTSTNY